MQLILNTSTQESLHMNVSTDNASFSLRHEYSLHWWHTAIWLSLKHDCNHKGALTTTLHWLSETRASSKSSLLRLSACYRQASTWFRSSNSKEGCCLFRSSAALSLPRNPPSPLFPLLSQVIGKKTHGGSGGQVWAGEGVNPRRLINSRDTHTRTSAEKPRIRMARNVNFDLSPHLMEAGLEWVLSLVIPSCYFLWFAVWYKLTHETQQDGQEEEGWTITEITGVIVTKMSSRKKCVLAVVAYSAKRLSHP